MIEPVSDELTRFRKWLTANGAQVLEPTNEWEIVRFRGTQGTGVLHKSKKGNLTCVGLMAIAREAFAAGKPMRFTVATARKVQGETVRRALVVRDGDVCFYHGGPIADDDVTVEHLVSVTHGGPNHIANKFLSCRACNVLAGHLSAPEKIRMREELQGFVVRRTLPIHSVLCEAA